VWPNQLSFQFQFNINFRYVHKVLDLIVCTSFYSRYVKLPEAKTPVEIKENPKLYPYFDHCLGAVDGSHIDAWVPDNIAAHYRNQKGYLSLNVFAAVAFDMHYVYVLSGWEGSAGDGQVFSDARAHDFRIPRGYYYLGDAGFALSENLHIPYCNTRYHLHEWEWGSHCPQNKEELFNLRHSQARNVIERRFGIDKRRFGLMTACPEYFLETYKYRPNFFLPLLLLPTSSVIMILFGKMTFQPLHQWREDPLQTPQMRRKMENCRVQFRPQTSDELWQREMLLQLRCGQIIRQNCNTVVELEYSQLLVHVTAILCIKKQREQRE
jgi:hypothetical protein